MSAAVARMWQGGAALLAGLRRALARGKTLGRTQLLWLGGAIALIVIGLALAFFGNPQSTQLQRTAVNVPLPPAG